MYFCLGLFSRLLGMYMISMRNSLLSTSLVLRLDTWPPLVIFLQQAGSTWLLHLWVLFFTSLCLILSVCSTTTLTYRDCLLPSISFLSSGESMFLQHLCYYSISVGLTGRLLHAARVLLCGLWLTCMGRSYSWTFLISKPVTCLPAGQCSPGVF